MKAYKKVIVTLLFLCFALVAYNYRLFEAHNFGVETFYDHRTGNAFDDERGFKMLMVCSGFTIDEDHVFCFISTYRKGDIDERLARK